VVGRACGELLAGEVAVFYAGRGTADFELDMASSNAALPDGMRFDVVIHVAADFGGTTLEDWFRTESVNALGVLNACRIARQAEAGHLLLVSTVSACYGPQDSHYGIYSMSKRHGDELAQLYCRQSGLPLTILRPSQLYDADSKCRKHQPLFYAIVDKAQAGEDMAFFGSNDALRNFLFLDDFADVVARTVKHHVLGVFNCAAISPVRLSEIAAVAREVFGRGGQTVFQHDRPDIADLPFIDGQQSLFSAIGYVPATALRQGLLRIKRARENP